MRRVSGIVLAAALAVVGLTACSGGDGDGSARGERRSAALVEIGERSAAEIQLTLDQITPTGQAIEARSFSWSLERPASQAVFNTFNISKTLDETSPKLFDYLASGRLIQTGVLKLWMDDGQGSRINYATYTMDRLVVRSVSKSGQAQGQGLPIEEVSFSYLRIREETQVPDAGGRQGPPVQFGWDIPLQRPW